MRKAKQRTAEDARPHLEKAAIIYHSLDEAGQCDLLRLFCNLTGMVMTTNGRLNEQAEWINETAVPALIREKDLPEWTRVFAPIFEAGKRKGKGQFDRIADAEKYRFVLECRASGMPLDKIFDAANVEAAKNDETWMTAKEGTTPAQTRKNKSEVARQTVNRAMQHAGLKPKRKRKPQPK